jgi:putative transposase
MDVGRRPEIFQGDQGCQFISGDFVARVHAEEIKISRAGRKRW